MELGLEGRRAVVTGGSKGIGLGCALRLAEEGCAVHVASRDPGRLEQAAKEIRSAVPNAEVSVSALDLSRADDRSALVDAAGEIDILVNNAGAIPAGDLTGLDDATWREAWELKVFGYIDLCRKVYPAMIARESGVILNVIGAAAVRPQPGYVAGAVGNAGLVALTRALGSRSLRHGVRVLGVNPGMVLTDRMSSLLEKGAADRFGDASRWPELVPSDPAPGRVDQIADVVAFLVSDRASHVSGTTLTVDGGASAR